MSDTEPRVRELIDAQLGMGTDFPLNAGFAEDLCADATDIVELLMATEAEFNIEIPDEKAERITTPKSLIDVVDLLRG